VNAVAGSAAAQEMPYRITDTIVGSVLPQEIIRSSAPIEGRYSELTPTQKAAVASDYENLPAGDEPPYPMYGVRHLISPVVRYADAGTITVYQSPDSVLARFVASQLATEEYKPAVCHGQPCEMTYVLRLDFPRRAGLHVSESTSTYDPNSKSHDGR